MPVLIESQPNTIDLQSEFRSIPNTNSSFINLKKKNLLKPLVKYSTAPL